MVTCRFIHIVLPEKAKTESTRIRWWQPTHSGANVDQWSVDGVVLSRYKDMPNLLDTFQVPLSQSESLINL